MRSDFLQDLKIPQEAAIYKEENAPYQTRAAWYCGELSHNRNTPGGEPTSRISLPYAFNTYSIMLVRGRCDTPGTGFWGVFSSAFGVGKGNPLPTYQYHP